MLLSSDNQEVRSFVQYLCSITPGSAEVLAGFQREYHIPFLLGLQVQALKTY